jgi:hypothetical protein
MRLKGIILAAALALAADSVFPMDAVKVQRPKTTTVKAVKKEQTPKKKRGGIRSAFLRTAEFVAVSTLEGATDR